MAKTVAVRKPRNKIVEQIKELTIKDLASGAGVGKLFQVVAGQKPLENTKYGGIMPLPPGELLLVSAATPEHTYGIVNMTYTTDTGLAIESRWEDSRYKVIEVPKGSALFDKFKAGTKGLEIVQRLRSNKHHQNVGSDPEIFAVDKNGSIVPAFEFLRSKRENPTTYWDGYQAEMAPMNASCLNIHIGYIRYALSSMLAQLKAANKDYKLTLKNTFVIPEERLKKDDPKFVKFGCNPSENAYGEPPMDVEGKEVNYRSAGGHLHFSCRKDYAPAYVKELDRVLGVISVAMFQYYDSPRRRELYGRAGEYRTPPHGMEYRVLSNAWLCHSAVAHFMYEISRVIIGQVGGYSETKNTGKYEEWDVTEDEARACINNCDVELALKLLDRNSEALLNLIKALPGVSFRTNVPGLAETWRDVILQGVHKFLKNPDELSSDWFTETGMNRNNMNTVAAKLVADKRFD